MNEIEVVNILKQCSDKKIDKVIKIPRFLYAAIWPHLTHSWPRLKHMYKAKYKTLGYRQKHYNY